MTASTRASVPFLLQPALALAAAALVLVFAACAPAARGATNGRVEVVWPERQLLFIGDRDLGGVRVFHLRAAPLLIGELRAPGRSAVRDIAPDPGGSRVWVLADGALYAHDARSFSLVRRIPAVGAGAAKLGFDAGGAPLLLAENGETIARIDPHSLAAERVALGGR